VLVSENLSMQRSIKVSLKFATAKKRRRLDHLLRRLRKLTNRYIDSLWHNDGELDAATLNAVPCPHLGYRQRSGCLKYALEIITATKKSAAALGVTPSKPRLKRSFRFSSLTATVERGRGSFDYVLKISGVVPGQRIVLPFHSHRRLNYWLGKPGAKLLNGCVIQGDSAVLWIRLPDEPPKTEGDELGVDIGYHKLLADSDGGMYGQRIKELCHKVYRRKTGSHGKRRARKERDDYIRWAVKQLPWGRIRVLAVENLKHLKRGKKKNRGKQFRKRIAPWSYRQALARVEQLAHENRVLLHAVNPRNTSRECSVCGSVAKDNRRGEKFRCRSCGFHSDADTNGARNLIARTRGNSRQPMVAGAN
jgi:IS605 OrfB family transposase